VSAQKSKNNREGKKMLDCYLLRSFGWQSSKRKMFVSLDEMALSWQFPKETFSLEKLA
jgi:hypothetical protein